MRKQFKQTKQLTNQPKRFQCGQGMTEYIIIVAVIAVAAIGAFGYFGDAVEHQVAGLAAEVSGTGGGAEIALAQTAATDAGSAAATHKSLANYDQNSQTAAGAD